MLNEADKHYINLLRGASVLRVMLAHLGLAWFLPPYSSYIGIFFPILFFVSGVVSFNSFSRSNIKHQYLINRILSICIPFFVFMIPVALIYAPHLFNFSVGFIMNWLVLRPSGGLFPFPIGQIWFITCLLFFALFSYPLFYFQKKLRQLLIISLIILVATPAFVTYEEFMALNLILPSFLSKYILFETLAMGQFFILGACYVQHKEKIRKKWLSIIGLLVLIIWLAIDIYARHSGTIHFSDVRPNTYIFQSLGVILLVLGLQDQLLSLLGYFSQVTKFLLHCNLHAYSIFILHIPILYSVEYLMGWQNVGGHVTIAIIRLLIVVILSILLAVPLTRLHKKVTNISKAALSRTL